MFVRVESTHNEKHEAFGVSPHPAQGKRSRSVRRNEELPHNNGMHPTANSGALIRKTPCLFS
jgi:hypothetical protein